MTVSMLAERHVIDWRAGARRVAWIPEPYRRPSVPHRVAMRMLRCTPDSFRQLEDLGLASSEGPDGPLYDPNDVRNAALYSGTGRTEVEIAMEAIFRYMKAGPEEVLGTRDWDVSLLVRSTEPRADGVVRVHRPTPEENGGSLTACRTAHGPLDRTHEHLLVPLATPVSGRLRMRGRLTRLVSRQVEEVARDVLYSGLRWHHLPPGLDSRPDEAHALGVASCVTMSAVLESAVTALGYEATAYRGWSIGTLVPHAWVDVVDDDGVTKRVDLSLALLATDNGLGTPEFADLVLGSHVNRVVPSRCPAVDPLVADEPPDWPLDVYDLRLTAQPARATARPPEGP